MSKRHINIKIKAAMRAIKSGKPKTSVRYLLEATALVNAMTDDIRAALATVSETEPNAKDLAEITGGLLAMTQEMEAGAIAEFMPSLDELQDDGLDVPPGLVTAIEEYGAAMADRAVRLDDWRATLSRLSAN